MSQANQIKMDRALRKFKDVVLNYSECKDDKTIGDVLDEGWRRVDAEQDPESELGKLLAVIPHAVKSKKLIRQPLANGDLVAGICTS